MTDENDSVNDVLLELASFQIKLYEENNKSKDLAEWFDVEFCLSHPEIASWYDMAWEGTALEVIATAPDVFPHSVLEALFEFSGYVRAPVPTALSVIKTDS